MFTDPVLVVPILSGSLRERDAITERAREKEIKTDAK